MQFMKALFSLALLALASPAFAQSLSTPNYGCNTKINGVTIGCPASVAFGGTGVATLTGLAKGNGTSAFSAAVAGTDYLTPTGNGSGLIGLLASQIGSVPTGVLKGSAGAFAAAVAGTDFLAPTGSGAGLTGLLASQIGSVPTGLLKGSAGAFAAAAAADVASLAGGSATPLGPGTAVAGASSLYARQDHVHPTDTSRAPVASPTFTGTVTIPSGASISGFAPLASPALTGTPTAPTASVGTNTTQAATTAFVKAEPVSAAQMPALTGSCTTTVGTVATTCEQDGPPSSYTTTKTYTGTAPTTDSVTANQKKIGNKLYSVWIYYNITNAGSANGAIFFSLPSGLTSGNKGVCYGVALTTGASQAAQIPASSTSILFVPYPWFAQEYDLQCIFDVT